MPGAPERVHHDTPDHVFAVAIVDVGARAIRDAVEDAGPVGETVLHEVAVQHRADVAVAGDGGREGALDEGQRVRRDEPLDAERLFLLADAQLGERTEAQIDVRVLENRVPPPKSGVRRKSKYLKTVPSTIGRTRRSRNVSTP